MIAAGRPGHGHGCKMPCESCAVQFSVFKRKRACCECERYYCSGCLRRGGGAMCAPCRALSTRPLHRNTIAHLKVRDLQCFLQRQNVSTRGCVEKEELVSLCVSHVNGSAYRRRGGAGGARSASGAFSSLKGFTNNINDFLNNAFDLRPAPAPAPRPAPAPAPPNHQQSYGCFNSSHAHRAPTPPPRPPPERFTTTPGGERDIEVPVPAARVPRAPSADSTRVDSADCFEIEDLDDTGWEFVTRPADPLPNDSEVLISAAEALRRDASQHSELSTTTRQPAAARRPPDSRPPADPQPPDPRPPTDSTQPADSRDARPAESHRSTPTDFETVDTQPRNSPPTFSRHHLHSGLSSSAGTSLFGSTSGAGGGLSASALELRGSRPASPGGASLRDEPAERATVRAGERVTLESLESADAVSALSVRQLKELLARNRVEYRGCVERRELEERARRLWRARAAPGADDLPIEDSCKICMAAPLECVLLECGHIAACTACAAQLAECPICRQYVVRAVRFFRS